MKETKTTREKVADKLYWFLRIGVLASVILLFFPTFNAAKIATFVNSNMSLFTTAVSYKGLTQDVGTLIRQMGAVKFAPLSTTSIRLLQLSAAVAVIGIAVSAAGGCMSLGNLKLKRRGNLFTLAGSVITLAGLYLITLVRTRILDGATTYDEAAASLGMTSDKYSKLFVEMPWSMTVFVVLAIVILVISLLTIFILPRADKNMKADMETRFRLFLIMLPFITLVFVFSYLPLYGWRYSFFNYSPGDTLSMDNFVGFKWFTYLFSDRATRNDVLKVLRNTLVMSGLGIATAWVPMAFAIFLNEVKCKWFKRFVQIFTTIPNFVSWVLVYSIAFAIFSTDGFINSILHTNTPFLMHSSGTWFKMLGWGMWKGVGWSAIIYIAGISGIDPQLYEAATVDGAGRTQKMWNITVPGLIPTFMVLLLMQIANVLTNGMEQYLVFANAKNKEYVKVLDYYVYLLGINSAVTNIPLSTVVSMAKSVVSVILLFVANGISKLIRGESIM